MAGIIRSFLVFAIIGAMIGCMSEPKTYAYSIIVTGGPSGWPVWVEEVTLNGDRRVPAGAISYGYEQTPPTGGRVVMGPSSAPEYVEARWFSHRTGKFHETLLSMPEGFEKSLSTWFDRYPTPAYRHYFIVGFSGKGEALAWWRASCTDCVNAQDSGFAVPIVASSPAQTVEGDTSGYGAQTQYYIDKGAMPPVRLDSAAD